MEKIDYVLVGNISYDYNYYPGRDGEELKENSKRIRILPKAKMKILTPKNIRNKKLFG